MPNRNDIMAESNMAENIMTETLWRKQYDGNTMAETQWRKQYGGVCY